MAGPGADSGIFVRWDHRLGDRERRTTRCIGMRPDRQEEVVGSGRPTGGPMAPTCRWMAVPSG